MFIYYSIHYRLCISIILVQKTFVILVGTWILNVKFYIRVDILHLYQVLIQL
jgi:hypothetical protein